MPVNAKPAARRVIPLVPPQTASGEDVLQVDRPFSASELQAMVNDGLLIHLFGATYLRAGARPGPQIRARAIAGELPAALRERAVIGRQSALWIHTGGMAPAKINLLVDHKRRTSALRPFSGCQLHEVHLAAADVALVSGADIRVTTPLRTAVDMALYAPEGEAAPAVRLLSSHPLLDCPLESVRARLEAMVRVPRKRAALALVDALDAGRDGG